jgi:pimeloyl-ACP methyl ester carboxylesterase
MKTYLLHGSCGSRHNFDYLQPLIPDSEAFDLIGFGEEQKPEATYDRDFFLTFLETKITEKCVLVGHSMGALLARDFAINHPELVTRLVFINAPLQSTAAALRSTGNQNIIIRLYLKNKFWSHVTCQGEIIWKWPVLWWARIWYSKYYESVRDYFRHTYHSGYSSTYDYLFQDNSFEFDRVKDKALFIVGERDTHIDPTLLHRYSHVMIPTMGHNFFGFEQEIAEIITSA